MPEADAPTASANASGDPAMSPAISSASAEETPANTPETQPVRTELRARGPLASEIDGIDAWINSDPLTIAGLQGQVVLIDFWTYTCVSCIRTLPYLKLWHSKYLDDGLVLVGVHTPEFEFEKDYDNVVAATKENGVTWPVAQDNDYITWRNFSNHYWPAKYLIDRDGVVTPELYAGYERNFSAVMRGGRPYVAQDDYYEEQDTVVELKAEEELEPHTINFNGHWLIESQRAKHGRMTADYEDYIDMKYSAKSVSAVLTSDSGEPYKVRVTMDGEFLTEENKGADIMIGEDGESFLLVTEPRLYVVVDNPQYEQERDLRMSSNSENFGLFAYVFGVYQDGP